MAVTEIAFVSIYFSGGNVEDSDLILGGESDIVCRENINTFS